MKLFLLAAISALALCAADIGEVKSVYVMPMPHGLDQFLALRLAHDGVVQVVTDPKKADALLTDRIGVVFEQKLDELYGQKDKDKDEKTVGMQPGTSNRGAIFLVDRQTRNVIWTAYERPKGTMPDDLNRTAGKIVEKLQKDRQSK